MAAPGYALIEGVTGHRPARPVPLGRGRIVEVRWVCLNAGEAVAVKRAAGAGAANLRREAVMQPRAPGSVCERG